VPLWDTQRHLQIGQPLGLVHGTIHDVPIYADVRKCRPARRLIW
jgi:hypothetical protein